MTLKTGAGFSSLPHSQKQNPDIAGDLHYFETPHQILRTSQTALASSFQDSR